MNYARLGRSGLQVSRICLGGMSFGDPGQGRHGWTLAAADSRAIIARAVDAGINFFDTANSYSNGSSEGIFGAALWDILPRHAAVLATKVNGRMREGPNGAGLSRKAILAEINASLTRLRTDFVDLYQIHRWDPETPIEETMEALHDVVKAGKARYIGASSMHAWQLAKADRVAERHGWTRFASMQNHWNLLYREEEREMVPLCADLGIGVVPWSPLARGRLARAPDEATPRSGSDAFAAQLYQGDDRAILNAVGEVAADLGASRAAVSLAWLLAQPQVAAPIVGTTRPEHLDAAIAALDLTLDEPALAALAAPYQPRRVAGFH
jgi:aryl-alcohol dehydrogenase-like predicted oxidoreductase